MNLYIILFMVGFIRTLVVILIVYYVFKLFNKYILPLILENKIRQMQENNFERNRRQNQTRRNEGDVIINHRAEKGAGKHTTDDGEYVDFEEIE